MMVPTQSGLYVAGVPAQTRQLPLPAWLFHALGEKVTAHKAKAETRRAAKDKQATLLLGSAAIVLDVLPHDGGRKLHVKQKSLSDIAPAMGYKHAATASRKISQVSPDLIKTTPTYSSNKYTWGVPESSKRRYKDSEHHDPSSAELARIETLARHFSQDDLSNTFFRHFAAVINHPNIPLTSTERIVLLHLYAHGLLVRDRASGLWKAGKVQQSQESIGAKTGLHRDTVRWALRRMAVEWTGRDGVTHKGLGLLKFIGKPGQWFKDGQPVKHKCPGAVWKQQESNEYIGVADFIESDKERYDRCMVSVRATRQAAAELMDQIYGDTRDEWLAKNGQVQSFYKECRSRMLARGVNSSLIDVAIPRPPT
ncbi:MAG TPA: hypothetical protein VN622_11045 [Clostridia bacterium]|nr:hypothetical protein [Clostridia bacterium]